MLDVNLWPFFGVLVVLLVIMMLVLGLSYVTTRGAWPALPVTRSVVLLPYAVRDDAIHIYILRDETLYFGNMRIESADVAGQVRDRVNRGSEKRVYMHVDGRVRYSKVNRV